MSTADKYTIETIMDVRPWTDSLFSFRTTRDRGYRFVPGQFARLGVPGNAEESIVWRAYSIASAAHDEHLEFFSVVVPNGAFTSRLSKLKEGGEILVERKRYGFLTTDRGGARRGERGRLAVGNYWCADATWTTRGPAAPARAWSAPQRARASTACVTRAR